MKVSFYSTAWNVAAMGFDYKDALDNWAVYADEIVVAIPRQDLHTALSLVYYAQQLHYPLKVVATDFNLDGSEPLAYGQTVNAALQACTGDLCILQDLDERFRVDKARLAELYALLQSRYDLKAFFVPTIDLYGSAETYLGIKSKWYVHSRGLFRGAAPGTLKADGRPDYDKTSSDELLDVMGNLVPTMNVLPDPTIERLRAYVAEGWPVSYHLGYISLHDRLSRSRWWSDYWKTATGGDPNKHPLTMEELAAHHTRVHELPLWPTISEIGS